jgi:hypothetical protein
MSNLNCPSCDEPMETGWLTVFNPMLGTSVAWQPNKPGYVRFRIPKEGQKVVRPRLWGLGNPRANICKQCKVVVFSYALDQLD